MKYVRAAAIFIFGCVLVVAVSGCAWSLLYVVLPDPTMAFPPAIALLVIGVLLAFVFGLKSLNRKEIYDRCPACAFDVRSDTPDPDGTLRCPACGQWLG